MAALIPRPAPGVGGWGFQLTSALSCFIFQIFHILFTIPICMDSKIVGRYFGHRSILGFTSDFRMTIVEFYTIFSRFWYGIRTFV